MKRAWFLALLAIGFLSFAWDSTVAQEKVFELDGMKTPVPNDWKEEKPDNRLRYLQFWLPADKKAKDKKEDRDRAELVIFKDITGTAEANVKRWKDMFIPPDGKTINDVAKLTEIKIGGLPAHYLDVSGTYKYKAAPFDPNAKVELRPDNRMVAIQWDGKNSTFHIRLVGPAKTVDQYKKGLDDWLKALK